MHIKLVIAVRDIESATSPLAKDVKKFEVAPPGTAAIIITPTANSTGKFGYKLIKINATIGKIIIWENKPVSKSFGWVNILVKSEIFKFRPKENIILTSQ